ncbi:MAG TPA: dihydrodipicolinate reductase C-terminal domain-containing protein [Thermomonas sp.]|jgi:4-hydroxy-tetrahydrodipicolinate reductase|uniref:4-hydroxy-tetrahydrodipicolinate reductase n=1 Tax=Thermomonas sp. TaxID=1971895 RepID=UPI002CCDFEE1|nr:dihydrodipicolinate reductase C-terminal domain-containing protein [Thermomonas sp.]HOZ24556.1 dihydrodipicolinate reductase C-terminal domain-containing protein [Thermomonas sp.]HPM56010.1 dihydrodipicolinate reductase C-terminal domain-containing protein [Thermomonas sp.]HPW11604.1 dihydrodipicolinate reductase C-terminal domain-containing protein [Thermomonas sp.]
MTNPVRLLVHGANGRMGQSLQRLCREENAGCTVVAAVSRTVDARVVDGIPQFASSELAGVPAFDVAVDFSLPAGFDAILGLCVARGAGLVSGTTGLSVSQEAALADAATRIPLAWASNFSLGVAVLHDLVERAARALPGWDCDIVESHHTRKRDAPSGTALTLGDSAGQGGATPHYASIRAGDIVGEHLVQFTTAGERIELIHRAGNRDIFARGALHVAARLKGRAAGRYRVADLL